MAKTYVCASCGRTFKAGRHPYRMNGDGEIICPDCRRREEKAKDRAKEEERLRTTGMARSRFSMISKILFGLLLVFYCVTGIIDHTITMHEGIAASALAVVLFLWAFLPYMEAKKNGF